MRRLIPILVCLPSLAFAGAKGAKAGKADKKGAAAAAATTPALPGPDVKRWDLANGMHVIYLGDHRAPVVTAQVFYHTGQKDEPLDKRGVAHMFEHVMFKGSTHVKPEDHAHFIDDVGGRVNAATSLDFTFYHQTVPPTALELAIKLEAERMRNLEFWEKSFQSEREVVKEEHRMRLENNPVTKAFAAVLKLAYKVHPYQELAIGEPAMLDRTHLDDYKKFYDTYYQPNNATLIVVGDTDEATVKKLADQYFGVIPKAPEPAHTRYDEPKQTAFQEQTLRMPVQVPVVIGAYHIGEGTSPDRYALEVIQEVLSGGESARLNQRLVRKDKVAVGAGGFVFANEDPGLFLLFAAFMPDKDPVKVKSDLAEEIERLGKEKLTAHELDKAKNQLAARAVFQREDVEGVAMQMGQDGIIAHDPLRQFSSASHYDALTAEDIQKVAKKYFVRTNYSEVTLLPAPKADKPEDKPVDKNDKPVDNKPAAPTGGAK